MHDKIRLSEIIICDNNIYARGLLQSNSSAFHLRPTTQMAVSQVCEHTRHVHIFESVSARESVSISARPQFVLVYDLVCGLRNTPRKKYHCAVICRFSECSRMIVLIVGISLVS